MSVPSYPEPTPDPDVLNHRLWRLEFGDGNFCVAEAGEQLYLVLFTSTERADQFLAGGAPEELSPARPVLFSESTGQFRRGALLALEEGLHGAIIDPDRNGQVTAIVDFTLPSAAEEAA